MEWLYLGGKDLTVGYSAIGWNGCIWEAKT